MAKHGKRVKVVHKGFYGPIECNGIERGGCVEVLDYPEIVFMSADDAKARQEGFGEYVKWYYGTNCEKCCGVYPKSCHCGNLSDQKIYFQCEVCGKRTEAFDMPWEATEAWNAGETIHESGQMSIFEAIT